MEGRLHEALSVVTVAFVLVLFVFFTSLVSSFCTISMHCINIETMDMLAQVEGSAKYNKLVTLCISKKLRCCLAHKEFYFVQFLAPRR